MPIYSYTCKKCGQRCDNITSVADRDKLTGRKCPECPGRMARDITAPALHMRYSNLHPRHMRGQRK